MMRDSEKSSLGERVLVLAPTGRDGRLLRETLEAARIAVELCVDVDALCGKMPQGVGALFIAEEALTALGLARLSAALQQQPRWSDVPIVVSTGTNETTDARIRALGSLRGYGTVTILERPVRILTMVVAVQAAIAARRRQYEKRDLNAQLQQQNEKLEALVQQANAARATAEGANRAKDEFLAMLGHELRNPLAPILTALELMRLRPGESFERERGIIERQAKHMGRLVDDLLDVSRVTRGMTTLHLERVELHELVAKAIETSAPLLDRSNHDLRVHVTQNLWVDGDAARLVQVISNLLNNAAKYTEAGGLIVISGSRIADDVVLKVRDTGCGVSAEMLPLLFEPFSQERQNIDRAQGGLGLGLAIVKSLVVLHRGEVSASSAGPGRGSEFVVRLPIALDFNAATGEGASCEPEARAPIDDRDGGILVVDDNEDAAAMLSEVLESLGYTTAVAHDGLAALDIASSQIPRAALVDIGLPVMDGYELAARLRELPGWADVRLVAVTGYGQESDKRRSKAAGFDHHLVKPVDLAALQRLLDNDKEERPSASVSGTM